MRILILHENTATTTTKIKKVRLYFLFPSQSYFENVMIVLACVRKYT